MDKRWPMIGMLGLRIGGSLGSWWAGKTKKRNKAVIATAIAVIDKGVGNAGAWNGVISGKSPISGLDEAILVINRSFFKEWPI